MASQAWVFFLAGSETSSSTTTFALVELANNVNMQNRLRDEIDESITKHCGLSYEGVMEMQYLDQIVSGNSPVASQYTVLYIHPLIDRFISRYSRNPSAVLAGFDPKSHSYQAVHVTGRPAYTARRDAGCYSCQRFTS